MSRSLAAPFILAAAGVLGGCSATMQAVKQDAGNLWDKTRAAAAPAITSVTGEVKAPEAAKPSLLNPTLEYVLAQEAAKRGKAVNFAGTCSQQLEAAAKGQTGPGPLNNPHAVNSIQNQVGRFAQGALNSATGGRDNVVSRSLNTLGNTGIAVSDAVGRQWSNVCNTVTQLNTQAYAADRNPVNSPNYTAQWNSIVSRTPTVVTLALNTEKGATAMQSRGTGYVITDVARTGLEKVIPTQQGVVPDFLNRLFK